MYRSENSCKMNIIYEDLRGRLARSNVFLKIELYYRPIYGDIISNPRMS